ncbi:MAG: response regulator [Candidatus Omnitrophica bacterium]|nr:response regulator [Candidatus Omnitrophota bacterium]
MSIPKRILIVDDEDDVRMFLKDFLDDRDMEVRTAIHGLDAMRVLETYPADIVLLDIMMPEMDGLETLKQIKKKYPAAIVIMITALKEDNRIEAAQKLGAHNYIIKPFSLQYLESELAKLLA